MAGYMEYKDSGIPWLRDIPAHWGIERGKNILTLLDRPVRADDEVITCFRDGEVTLRKNRREEGFTLSLQEVGYQGIEPGDLVVHGMDGFAGSIGVSDSRGKATPVLNVMDSPHNKRYLMYYLRMAAYKDVFLSLSTGIRVRSCDLRWNKLAVFPFVIPERTEQDAVVEYIDRELAKADVIIAEAKASVEEYKAWKASIIYEAVTKGLDPNVEMQESGIEWIGKIPKHWHCCRQKHHIKLINGRAYKDSEFEEEGKYRILRVGNLFSNPKWYTSSLELDDEKYCDNGDLLYAWSMSYGPVIWTGEKVIYHYHIWKTQLSDDLDKRFAYYYLIALSNNIRAEAHATTMGFVTMGSMNNSYIAYPSVNEQILIAEYLDKKSVEIDAVISEKHALIADLEAYKKSLIFEVVTGKRKVV